MGDEAERFSLDLCHEFEAIARKVGWKSQDLALLTHNEESCKQVLAFLRGYAELKALQHVVDFDASPVVPPGWEIRESDQIFSRLRGIWTFNPGILSLYISKRQKREHNVIGTILKDDLSGKVVAGAQLLDFFLAKPQLLPRLLKGKTIFFWGTIYRDSMGRPCVRHLYWDGKAWDCNYRWLTGYYGVADLALLIG